MKILYIGTPDTYRCYCRGENPSHWLYGAVEMERDGHNVVWETEKEDFFHDWRLVRQHRPDIVFIPNLNLHNHFLLLLLAALGVSRRPVYAWLHHEPRVKQGIRSRIYRMLLSGCRHLFFLSGKTMDETVAAGLVDAGRCSVPGWGADRDFFSKMKTSDSGWFVSTGKENRDFDTLIEAFRRTGAPLRIITSRSHAGSDYADLPERCRDIPNIEVVLTDNSGQVYPMMLREMAAARALVCPLRHDRLNYCVGLSTIADAEGLGKPLIITRNPYHDSSRMGHFHVVDTVDDWCRAIRAVQSAGSMVENGSSACSIQIAYERMKPIIFLLENKNS